MKNNELKVVPHQSGGVTASASTPHQGSPAGTPVAGAMQSLSSMPGLTVEVDGRIATLTADQARQAITQGLKYEHLTGQWGTEKSKLQGAASQWEAFDAAMKRDPAGTLAYLGQQHGLSVGQPNTAGTELEIVSPGRAPQPDVPQDTPEVAAMKAELAELKQLMGSVAGKQAMDLEAQEVASTMGASADEIAAARQFASEKGLAVGQLSTAVHAIRGMSGTGAPQAPTAIPPQHAQQASAVAVQAQSGIPQPQPFIAPTNGAPNSSDSPEGPPDMAAAFAAAKNDLGIHGEVTL